MVKGVMINALFLGLTICSSGVCSYDPAEDDSDLIRNMTLGELAEYHPDLYKQRYGRSPSPAPDIAHIGSLFQLDEPELAELKAFLKDHNSIRIKFGHKVGTGILTYPVPEQAEVIFKREREDAEEDKPPFRSMAEIPGC